MASESMDRPLPWPTRLKLLLHYWICDACARYRRQLLLMREAMRHQASHSISREHERPSQAVMARLKDVLRSRQQ